MQACVYDNAPVVRADGMHTRPKEPVEREGRYPAGQALRHPPAKSSCWFLQTRHVRARCTRKPSTMASDMLHWWQSAKPTVAQQQHAVLFAESLPVQIVDGVTDGGVDVRGVMVAAILEKLREEPSKSLVAVT